MTRRQKLWRSFGQAGLTVGSAVASAMFLYVTLPLWLGAMIFGVLILHEFAHYFTALATIHRGDLPYFIPLGIGILGVTHIYNFPYSNQGKLILMMGPLVGGLVALGIAIWAGLVALPPVMYSAIWILLFQLYSASFGADGRKFRRITRVVREHEAAQAAQGVSV